MPTFVLERIIPLALVVDDPDIVALHSRWATDAYQVAGIVWLGGVATDKGNMYSLVAADDVGAIHRYRASLGVKESEYKLSEVKASLGPHVAMAPGDPRYRAMKKS